MQRLLSAFLIILMGTALSQAQETQPVQRITLQDAIDIALENNFQLKQAENNLQQAKNNETREYADYLPSLNGNFSGSINQGQQFIPEIFQFGNFTSRNLRGSISSNMTVFSGFNNILTLRSSQNTRLSAEENLKRQRETVIFNAASNFLNVILNESLLEIARENLVTSEKQLEQIEAQVDVGTRPVVDLYNQEATVANNELQVTNSENQLNLSKVILIRQLQIDPLGNYEFVIPEFEAVEEEVAVKNFDLSQLVQEAMITRADIKSAEYNIKSQEFQMLTAKWAFLPTISVNGTISSSYSDQSRDPVSRESVSFSEQFFDRQITKGAGFSIQVPLFTRLQTRTNFLNSKIAYKNAKLNLENTQLQAVQELTQAYNDYVGFTKELESSRKALIATEKAFESEQERYNVGASTLIELSQAQASYVQAQSDYTRSIYNLIFQEQLLDFFIGKLDEMIVLK